MHWLLTANTAQFMGMVICVVIALIISMLAAMKQVRRLGFDEFNFMLICFFAIGLIMIFAGSV